jgi:MFS family permease
MLLLRDRRKVAVFAAAFAAQASMSLVMAVTAVAMAAHGHGIVAIGGASAVHAAGMFGFAIPQGRLADRAGRRPILIAGLLLCAVGAAVTASGSDYRAITLGFFLVGFGWSYINVAATALLADLSSPGERGRVVGVSDAFAGAGNILLALAGGPLVALFGMPALGLAGTALMAPPLLLLLKTRDPDHYPLVGEQTPPRGRASPAAKT